MKVITINVCGIECTGRLEEIRILLVKYDVDVAILSETETSHSLAATTSVEGYKAFCPPKCVTGPPGKEAGVIVLISQNLASSCKLRPDINGSDTIQTVWIELTNHDILIGGVYRRGRNFNDLEKLECSQLNNQILKGAQSGKGVLLMGDTNMDHTNPNHRWKNEAKDLLSTIEAASMRRLPTGPTWKSFGLHKVCPCDLKSQAHSKSDIIDSKLLQTSTIRAACGCPKRQKVSTIDNAFLSLSKEGTIKVLDDSFSDHYPIMVTLIVKSKDAHTKLKNIWRRDLARLKTSDLENSLQGKNWFILYDLSDPNMAVSYFIEKVTESLDEVAPLKLIKFRPDKPILSLKQDTLAAMSSRERQAIIVNTSN